jgi:hypothetical protein
MPRLDSEYLEESAGNRRPRPSVPSTGQRVPRPSPRGSGAIDAAPEMPRDERSEGFGTLLWPALASFALVFAGGVYVFWLLHPGQQPQAVSPPPGIELPAAAVVVAWLAALALLPRLLPRGLGWLVLTAGTVFVAIVLSREVTDWLQAVLGTVQM